MFRFQWSFRKCKLQIPFCIISKFCYPYLIHIYINWSFPKSKMPGISAKLEMVLSNDSTKFEPFLYGKKNGAGSQKIGHFGPSMTACTKQNIFQTPCTIFFTLWKWLKFGRIIAEHHPNLCWVPWHFRFLKRPVIG